jgi:hypothetical protein
MNVADRVPDAVGESVIDTLQLVPVASVRPEQPSLTCVKSSGFAPRVAALLMNNGALPVLAIVIDCGALVVPIACAAKVSDVGVNVTAGAQRTGMARHRLHRRRDRPLRLPAPPEPSMLQKRGTASNAPNSVHQSPSSLSFQASTRDHSRFRPYDSGPPRGIGTIPLYHR